MAKRILLSLGGNALGTDFDQLVETAGVIAKPAADLVEKGYEVVICHGNGPQVGMIKTNIDKGKLTAKEGTMPLSECVAMSQSYIGYHLQNAIENQLRKKGIDKNVVTLITRVEVDPKDPGFQHPTKPIGAFYTEEESKALEAKGKTMVEDSGRGYREVVASPLPKSILEREQIRSLVEAGHIVIAGGGGGIPVYKEREWTRAIDAVIDKDWVSVMLAADVEADSLVILTGVEKVAIHFNKPDQQWLDELKVSDALRYIDEGEFPAGSMLPKIQAALKFTQSAPGRKTLITSLDKLVEGLAGETGTWIVQD